MNQLFITANASMKVTNQFGWPLPVHSVSLLLFSADQRYQRLTHQLSTINYAAANLATLLDTNANTNLGSGGTHIDEALNSVNGLISSGTGTVGDGSTPTTPQPYVFLVTDGAQDTQIQASHNGNWHGSNRATCPERPRQPYPTLHTLKDRGIIVSVLYIPYETISPVNTSFAGNEDTYANNNIPNIPPSLQACASPGFFYTANSPADITAALNAMFNHALQTAHITN